MKYFLLTLILPLTMGVKSCNESSQLKSLCITNISDQVCWLNKSELEGFDFSSQEFNQNYCLNKRDFDKVVNRLLECKKLEESCRKK